MPYRVVATEILDGNDRVVFDALDNKRIRRALCEWMNKAEAAEARTAMLQEALGPNARILNKRRDEQIKQLKAERDEARRQLEQAVAAEREAILALADELEFKPSKWSDLLTEIRARK